MIRSLFLAVAAAAAFAAAPAQAQDADAGLKDCSPTSGSAACARTPRAPATTATSATTTAGPTTAWRRSRRARPPTATRWPRCKAIDRNALSAERPAQLRRLRVAAGARRSSGRSSSEYLQPVSHQGGVQTADGIAEVLPFAHRARTTATGWRACDALPAPDRADHRADARRAEGRQHAAEGADAARARRRSPRRSSTTRRKSPFYKPFAKFPDAVPQAERARLQAEAQQVIAERVVPAYRAASPTFFNDEYLPKRARVHRRGRPARWQGLLRLPRRASYTTTDLTADADPRRSA